MTQAEKEHVIKRLMQFNQDYNFTGKEIAKKLNTTEAAVSHWFCGDTLPRTNKVKDIYKLFEKYCIPGIIKIPQNKHWTAWFFVQVDDIKNPYESYHTDNTFGEAPAQFALWIKDWKEEFPAPEIYRQYEAGPHGRTVAHLECMNLNTTIEFRNYFIGCPSIQEAYLNLNPSCFDYMLANAWVYGEVDGAS